MNNNISPDKNFHSKEEKEALGEETFLEEVTDDEEEVNDSFEQEETGKTGKEVVQDEFRKKMMFLFIIVFALLIAVLVIGFVISLFTKKDYTYFDLEDVMQDSAISYFKDNPKKLPKSEDEIVEITTSSLISEKYMKEMDHYIKNGKCSGKVSVSKIDKNNYKYYPYLSCGTEYTTKKLADQLKDKKVVTEGFGIYHMNGEYVYRGSNVNNYLKFEDSDRLFRIVKIDKNDEIVIIDDSSSKNRFVFDERYNTSSESTTGINTFKNSNISEVLEKLYQFKFTEEEERGDYFEEDKLFTKEDKKLLVKFKSCVGARGENDTSKNGSSECQTTYETNLSLLPVYDFLNASLDINCTSTIKPDCQNYNYLKEDYSYWLLNGSLEVSDRVYVASDSITKREAYDDGYVRAVAHLLGDTRIKSGTGTKNKPYIIR